MYRRRWLTRFIEGAGMTKCAEWSRILPAPGGLRALRTGKEETYMPLLLSL